MSGLERELPDHKDELSNLRSQASRNSRFVRGKFMLQKSEWAWVDPSNFQLRGIGRIGLARARPAPRCGASSPAWGRT